VLYVPMLVSQVIFGATSGFVSLVFPDDVSGLEEQNKGKE